MASAPAEGFLKQFEKKINSLQELDQNGESGFAREFQALRQTSFKYKGNSNYSTKAGESPMNRVKNRFKDILPFDYSRVQLPTDDDSPSGFDYINANFIKGVDGEKAYIASQGPLPNTVNDFWRMLWTFKVKIVVMLCREEENGKRKCQRYWCENDEENLNFGDIVVRTERCIGVGNDFVMRTLVAECEGEKLMITQFHYTAWPDHGVPSTALPLINLIKLVREYQPEDNPPIVLHCSAGCGRTGTISALDYTRSLLKEKKYKDLVPYRIVENLRKQRHAMVQTKGQYEFLCRAMCALFREKLDLPIEEDHEDHLYENVVPLSPNSDSDSDFTPSSPIFFRDQPGQQIPNKKVKPKLPPSSPAKFENKKRIGQVVQQHPSEDYVNVAFDLVDFSDVKPTSKSTGMQKPKLPVSRQPSAPEIDTSSDYVVPARETKASRSLPNPSRYENVQPVATRPATSSHPVISLKPTAVKNSTSTYENVEVGNFNSNPGRKSPNQSPSTPSHHDRHAKPALPDKQQEFHRRSESASNVIEAPHRMRAQQNLKVASCGPRIGAKYSDQMNAMNGLQRARVLPNEETGDAENAVGNETDEYVNSGAYASVNKKGSRKAINENTFRAGDSVDGDGAPSVRKKSAENVLSIVDEQHEFTNDAKNKTSSLTKKIPFLARRPEVKGITVEHIGFGKRVPKPKGPRSPPQSWMVKS